MTQNHKKLYTLQHLVISSMPEVFLRQKSFLRRCIDRLYILINLFSFPDL